MLVGGLPSLIRMVATIGCGMPSRAALQGFCTGARDRRRNALLNKMPLVRDHELEPYPVSAEYHRRAASLRCHLIRIADLRWQSCDVLVTFLSRFCHFLAQLQMAVVGGKPDTKSLLLLMSSCGEYSLSLDPWQCWVGIVSPENWTAD